MKSPESIACNALLQALQTFHGPDKTIDTMAPSCLIVYLQISSGNAQLFCASTHSISMNMDERLHTLQTKPITKYLCSTNHRWRWALLNRHIQFVL